MRIRLVDRSNRQAIVIGFVVTNYARHVMHRQMQVVAFLKACRHAPFNGLVHSPYPADGTMET